LSDDFETEELVKQIGLISHLENDIKFVYEFAQTLGIEVLHFKDSSFSQAIEKLNSLEDSPTLFARTESLEELVILDQAVKNSNRPVETHLFVADVLLEKRSILLRSHSIENLLFVKNNFLEESGQFYAHATNNSENINFGIKNHWPSREICRHALQSSHQKKSIADEMRTKLIDLKMHDGVVNAAVSAIDELIMNAFFDAPVDENGLQLYANTDRSELIQFDDITESVLTRLSTLGDFAALQVTDSFGSANRVSLLTHACRSLSRTSAAFGQNAKSSGLGLAMVLGSGGSLKYRVKSGERTEANVYFRTNSRPNEVKSQFQFISVSHS
jgi:hypothetical protein